MPALLDADGITAQTRRDAFTRCAQPLYQDLADSLTQLSQQPQVAGRPRGTIGLSSGGYFALWLATTGRVRTENCYYGVLSGAGTDQNLRRFAAVLERHSSPVLVLHGDKDNALPAALALQLAQPLQIYAGAGHRFERETGAANQAAADDAWQRSLAGWQQHLSP
ncbi:dienelactone hydrolase family protein [Paludibacterium sp. B53371]|uniref:dienelactone hydrolase family protein n=1 Tax=Paludibacterium sp. B53371 TaxID=2806263 RepID=UPI00352FF02E